MIICIMIHLYRFREMSRYIHILINMEEYYNQDRQRT